VAATDGVAMTGMTPVTSQAGSRPLVHVAVSGQTTLTQVVMSIAGNILAMALMAARPASPTWPGCQEVGLAQMNVSCRPQLVRTVMATVVAAEPAHAVVMAQTDSG